jgi:hypothetical protein
MMSLSIVLITRSSAWIVPQDIDADGDQDLVGTLSSHADADVCLWVNKGSPQQAKFGEAKKLGKNAAFVHPSRDRNAWRLISPGIEYTDWQKNGLARKKEIVLPQAVNDQSIWTLADYNGDGHTDVIVFSQNTADAKARIFYGRADGTYATPFVLQVDGKDFDATGISSPHFVNMDEDDDLDLICLNARGHMIYYENSNTNSEPLYAKGRPVATGGLDDDLIVSIAAMTPFDANDDGDMDLLTVTGKGAIVCLIQSGQLTNGDPVFFPLKPWTQNISSTPSPRRMMMPKQPAR